VNKKHAAGRSLFNSFFLSMLLISEARLTSRLRIAIAKRSER